MRFEEQTDNVVLRYPEVRVYETRPTSFYPLRKEGLRKEGLRKEGFRKEGSDGVALGRRLHGKFWRETVTGAIRAIATPVLAVVRKIAREHAYRATLRSLRSLEDHRLQDIGIERRDIRSIARALAYGEPQHKVRLIAKTQPAATQDTFEAAKAA